MGCVHVQLVLCVELDCLASAPRPCTLCLQLISKPASADVATDVAIDASQSADPSGRPLTRIVWAVTAEPAASNGSLAKLVALLNNKTSV